MKKLLFLILLYSIFSVAEEKIDYLKCGVEYNCTHKFVIPPQFHALRWFQEGLVAAQLNKGDKWGYINKKEDWKWVILPRFKSVWGFNGGVSWVEIKGKSGYGLIDKQGSWIVPPKFEWARPFTEGLAWVRLKAGGKFGAINTRGKLVIPHQFLSTKPFSEGLAVVQDDSRQYGYISINEKEEWKFVIPPQFYDAANFSEGLARVTVIKGLFGTSYFTSEKDGYISIDENGEWEFAIPPKFNHAFSFQGGLGLIDEMGLSIFNPNRGYRYINKSGEIAFPGTFYEAKGFYEGLARVRVDSDEWEFINKSGKPAFPLKFNFAQNFNEGLAWVTFVKSDEKFGAINKEGKFVLPTQFQPFGHFKDGLSIVKVNGKMGMIKVIKK